MRKQNRDDVEKQLREEADLVTKSVDFWAAELEKTFVDMDKIEADPEADDYEVNMNKIFRRLEHLIIKGDHEEQAIINLEKKLCKHLRVKTLKELKLSSKVKKKRKKNR